MGGRAEIPEQKRSSYENHDRGVDSGCDGGYGGGWGVATDPDGGWYRSLRKPDWQPPAIAFPVVWTALYADLAVSSAVALDSGAGTGAGSKTRQQELAAYRSALAAN